ncbi:MAG: ribonuclease J [Pseudodesulfovibrio sp.]|uniref:Ribonuclease J n=1 Tax=Pseudodesulfovibrio aespoeensis (strain ATCC 700646 / DSM 10631 / Aspo-2) TaxID=643562 RepID=E6VST5_PSEA9|nr:MULTISPECIES: ribonuclease J [Pseudodesulfovibrio]MBU4243880.1 ribonuclease J [Pseudomonadota bacterium]ADU63179.1 RNA-metabolising metallo-beta-lactamase [Pseudodesulfovibrio aespoeensis Aspo-2]MBU4378290.1 ribonuclease J [Pseudomonadota bacterium]MBU4475976.1 ribonuclease J [Pseudomonadota bacterium]MBU4516889.1 ribonuclease J [Pseudomonadota bacterium]
MADTTSLTFYPLGGLGEIGMNCMAFKTERSMVLVDCGLMFPEDYHFGVDVVIPCFDFVLKNKAILNGIVLTHGHEDHIGALPWLLQNLDVPVYGSQFTLGLVENKLREHDLARWADLRTVRPYDRVLLGDFTFNFFPVCHSIIEGFGLGIETPVGRVVHTGDFKIDRNPMGGHATDLAAFRRFSEPGVRLMLSDSTNVGREGFALTEREIKVSLREIFSTAKGRILVSLFSSHIQRIQEVFDLADAEGRKVAVSGKSLVRNIELARDLGYLKIPKGIYIELDRLDEFGDSDLVLLITGSQGEPLAALSRMALGEHRQITVKPEDLYILSSRFIPGNVRAITRVINNLYRLGAEVLYEKMHGVHASGHAHAGELTLMLETVRPRYFIPVHGEYRHLVKHSRLAVDCGVEESCALVVEDGQPVIFEADGSMRMGQPFRAEKILVDGKGVGDVGQSVLRERQLLAGEGMVIVVLVVDEATGEISMGPDIMSKGFIFEQQYMHLLDDAKCIVLDVHENIAPGDTAKLKERIRSALRRFFRKVLGRDPVVVPLVITI